MPKPQSLKSKNKSKSHTKTSLSSQTQTPLPKRRNGHLVFPDFPEFKPNLSPKQILQMGSFGGTYFRSIDSGVTKRHHANVHKEFPSHWYDGLNESEFITSSSCNEKLNKYGVKAGSSLKAWEDSGWIKEQDPYGWFQWYCRFYLGRRSKDDQRQVNRWDNYAGEVRGRWRINLIGKIKKAKASYNDSRISPVIRQGLQHWAYRLTKSDYEKAGKKNDKQI
jgi:hypothetical protein